MLAVVPQNPQIEPLQAGPGRPYTRPEAGKPVALWQSGDLIVWLEGRTERR